MALSSKIPDHIIEKIAALDAATSKEMGQITEKFEEFLDSYGVKNKFIANTIKNREYSNYHAVEVIDRLCRAEDRDSFIYVAFDWDNSKEGYDFWDSINDEWLDELEDDSQDGNDHLMKIKFNKSSVNNNDKRLITIFNG